MALPMSWTSRGGTGFQGLVCSGADLLGGLGKRLGINEEIHSEFLQGCYLDSNHEYTKEICAANPVFFQQYDEYSENHILQ